MNRRRFLYISIPVFLSTAVFIYWWRKTTLDPKVAFPKFLSHLCGPKTIREIGVAYRNAFRDENGKRKLSALLMSGFQGNWNDPTKTDAYFAKQIQKDFNEGHVVVLHGWVLSHTEARLCALYSFLQP